MASGNKIPAMIAERVAPFMITPVCIARGWTLALLVLLLMFVV